MEKFDRKQKKIYEIFKSCTSQENYYNKIIEFGQQLKPMEKSYKIEDNLIQGCQSLTYLHCECKNGLLFFQADSNALISKGLAAILIYIYNEATPEEVIASNLTILEKIGITKMLSFNRTGGLESIHMKMKKFAISSICELFNAT